MLCTLHHFTLPVFLATSSYYCCLHIRFNFFFTFVVNKMNINFFQVRKVTYRPPGTEHNLLNEINLSLREKRLAHFPWNSYISGSFYIPNNSICAVLVWYLDGVGVERPPFYRCTLKCSVTLLNFLIFCLSAWSNILVSQLLAGLSEPTSGSICIQKYDDSGNPIGMSEMLTSQRVGIVFQFPERFELLLSWRLWLSKVNMIAFKLWFLKISLRAYHILL